MNYNSIYPAIFGCITLHKNKPLKEPNTKLQKLFELEGRIAIYQKGQSKEIHKISDKTKTIILFGRIFSPFQLNWSESDCDKKTFSLLDFNIETLKGNFVLFKISKSENDIMLSIFTDKYGFKRVLYLCIGQCLFFATHISGIKILLENELPSISNDVLFHYYNFGISTNERTILDGIRKVPPGSILVVKKEDFFIKKYFSIESLYHPEKYKEWPEEKICTEIDNLLFDSVQKRIPNGANLGVALSGGVDSGYIIQKLVQGGSQPIGFNLAYSGYYNEFDRVDYLAWALGIKVHKISISPNLIINNYEYCNSISSEPMGFNSATMRFIALRAKKGGVSTLFDGDGADRIFLGMFRYLKFIRMLRLYSLFKKTKSLSLAKHIVGILPGNEFRKLYIHFQNWSKGISPYTERDMTGLTKYDPVYEQKVYDIAVRNFRSSFEQEFRTEDFGLFFTYLAIKMCPEMFFYDPCEIQTELGIFPVSAFWDDDLISLAISLPMKWKLHHGTTKYILRRAAAKNLDKKFWMLPKIGLQNSFHYVCKSKEGKDWKSIQHDKVMDSPEYKELKKMVPDGKVLKDRLINLIVWKEKNQII